MDSAECATDVKVTFAEIEGKFDQIMSNIDTVKDKQDEMAKDIVKIKEAVYHPDQGLYARLRELESWKQTSTRLLWMVTSAVIGLTAATAYKLFF